MNEQPSRFEELMRQMRDGSKAAAHEVLDLYGPHILRVIRRSLDARLRTHFDSIDFQQDVWASFFTIPADRITFRHPDELAAYLSAMAGNKVAEAFRGHAGTQKRDVLRQRSLDAVGESNPAIIRRHEATPSQVAVAGEFLDRLHADKSDVVRRILEMRLKGHSFEDIAAATGLHEKAIQRHLRRLRKEVES